ncbi:MAG: PDZ domain-containing protein [Thermovirgaceae bacterium]|nr:PDZ domain-containing protein [Thermovirgaceae bacterium]
MKTTRLAVVGALCLLLLALPSTLPAAQVEEPQTFQMGTFNLKNVPVFSYEDGNILVTWRIRLDRMQFELINRTPGIIEVEWDKFSFTDADGRVSRVIRNGVQYVNRDNPQPSMILPPRGRVSDYLLPVGNIYWNDKPVEYEKITVTDEDGKKTILTVPKKRDKADNSNWNICELAPWPAGGRIFCPVEKYKRVYSRKQLSMLMTLTLNGADTRYYVFNFDFPMYADTPEPEDAPVILSMAQYLELGQKTGEGYIIIKGVAMGSQAEKKGIIAGDILMEIDGTSVTGMGVKAVEEYIAGMARAGKSVIVVYSHQGSKNIVMLK